MSDRQCHSLRRQRIHLSADFGFQSFRGFTGFRIEEIAATEACRGMSYPACAGYDIGFRRRAGACRGYAAPVKMMTNVSFSGTCFMGGERLFGPLELTLREGGWTCILGPSGVGKSTILRLIAGLEIGGAFEGEIDAPDVAYMAQDDLLFPWLNVLDNAVLGARLRGEVPDFERAKALIGRVGLTAQIEQKPPTLSGGQRQRVALVRTMMEDRPVILLDEPFSALDARNRAQMQELAVELFAGRTVLLITHDPAEAARLSDVIYILDEAGLRAMAVPECETPRAVDDAAVLRAQGALFKELRA